MIIRIVILFLLFQCTIIYCGENPKKSFYEMTNQEIDSVIRELSKKKLTPTQKINYISEYFLGTPYNFKCVGDGPYALFEPWPLVNFKETNCMAYCEHALALSISDNWDHFFNNLQQIRYKDGVIGMKTRNHYTMADWLPENNWILKDVSAQVGGKYTNQVTCTISHQTFFAGKGITDTANVLPDRTITIDYVPLEAMDELENNTRPGDIMALLFANMDNIFSAHMLMIAEKDGKKYIRESSNSNMSTFDTPYLHWVADKQTNKAHKYIGLAFIRVKDDLNTPGRIIQPWEINKLK